MQILSAEKWVRLAGIIRDNWRVRGTYDVIVGKHLLPSMFITEWHINRGYFSEERVISIKCDLESLSFLWMPSQQTVIVTCYGNI